MCRDHAAALPVSQHAVLLEVLASAAAAMHPKARARPWHGPGPVAKLRRVLPAAPPLQPVRLTLGGNNSLAAQRPKGAAGAAGPGPFIFNPYAGKRQAGVDAEVTVPEWVRGSGSHRMQSNARYPMKWLASAICRPRTGTRD